VQWIEEGEKPTKYFCGLESKIFSKIIPKIEKDDGKTITKQFDILKETKVFYEELYKFGEGNGCKVSDLERVTPPFSINFRCQIENQVSDYRLL
jgi:hypothetical protein